MESSLPRDHPMRSRHCSRETWPKEGCVQAEEVQPFRIYLGASALLMSSPHKSFRSILRTNYSIVRQGKGPVVSDDFGM